VDRDRLRRLEATGLRVLRKPVAAGELVMWFATLGARSDQAAAPAE
jgi:hypothetical protein